MDKGANVKCIQNILIGRNHTEIFTKDLLGLSSTRIVEFQIDLVPGVAPVTKAPYCLAPSEMQELSRELQELLSKRLIKTGKPLEFQIADQVLLKVSPWKGMIRFGKRGKLNPRYTRPFKVLLLQEFTTEIKDKKGIKNMAADHLFRIKKPKLEKLNEEAICDSFPDEHLMEIHIREVENNPWYVDYVNFLVSKIVPHGLTYHLRKKFLPDIKHNIWDDPYLFKSYPDGIIRRCVFGKELHEILEHCHMGTVGGHYGTDITARKVFESEFYWQPIFKDSARYVRECDACQTVDNIFSHNQMPLNNILVSEVLIFGVLISWDPFLL
ncbi:reverse transcriptase domain-containing protein [Tanacetum coccineum]